MARPCGKLHGNMQIARIVGRLHVGDPPDEAVAYVRSRLRPGAWEAMAPSLRRAFDCEVRRVHRENLELYLAVMGGRL